MSISRQDLLGELLPGLSDLFGVSFSDTYLDGQILANPNSTFHLAKLMNMEQQELALNNIWRLEITASGLYKLNDFTLPSNDVIINKMRSKEQLPKWMLESLAVLQILDDGEMIDKVGKKIDSSIFYLIEPFEE